MIWGRSGIIAVIALMCQLPISTASAQLNPQQIQIIKDTAASVCDTVKETIGKKNNYQIQGDVEAKLGGLVGKVVNVGGTGKGSLTHEDFVGLSQEATATAMEGDRGCRERVFNKMFDKLGANELDPKTRITREFNDVLKQVNITLMYKEEFLLPEISDYLASPTKDKWDHVVREARVVVDQVKRAIELSMTYDSQFADSAAGVIQLVDSTGEIVDRRFIGQFKTTRQIWNGHAFELQEIVETRNTLPDRNQVLKWQGDMKSNVIALRNELQKLITKLRQA